MSKRQRRYVELINQLSLSCQEESDINNTNNTKLNVKHARKLKHRKGVLKASIGVYQGKDLNTVNALLDTCASRAIIRSSSKYLLNGSDKKEALEELQFIEDRELYRAAKRGAKVHVKSLHGTRVMSDLGVVRVRINGANITVLAIMAADSDLPSDVELLVDADTLRMSNIDVQALLHSRDAQVPSSTEEPLKVDTADSAGQIREENTTEHINALDASCEWVGFIEEHEYIQCEEEAFRVDPRWIEECYLSELKCKQIMSENPYFMQVRDFKEEVTQPDVNHEGMTAEEAKRLTAMIRSKKVWATTDALPPPMKHASKVHFDLKPGAEPVDCGRPRWGKFQELLLMAWTQRGLKDGALKLAPSSCQWANRPHVVMKPDGKSARVTGDYVRTNDRLPKLPVNLPSQEDVIRKHKGAKFFTQVDAIKGYNQLEIDEDTQQICALWTPLGLMVPTRLTEGTKNAGHYYQGAVTKACLTMKPSTLEKHSNYMDDHIVSGKTFDEYYKSTEDFLDMCVREAITLNPKKCKFGYSKVKILGRELNGDDISIHEDNLLALKQGTAPETVSELRSFLSLCAYANRHVKDFATIAKPLHDLTRKGAIWRWSPEVNTAYVNLKEEVLKKMVLQVPDSDKPLYLFTDASDHGMGAHLCQLRTEVSDADLGKVKDEDKLTIAFYSASFDLSMQQRPVYYREAKAVIWALEKAKALIEQNPYPVVVATDHAPLQWIKNTNKGVVSAWLIENVADTEFRIVYIPGKTNTTADALSRPPMVSPSKFNLAGCSETWDALLKSLPEEAKYCKRVHVWSANHTPQIQSKVQLWRKVRNPVNVLAPKSMLQTVGDFDLILTAPAAEEAPIVAHHILKTNPRAIVACLVPTDLLNYIPTGGEVTIDREVKNLVDQQLRDSIKYTFSSTNYTWVIANTQRKGDKVFTTEDLKCQAMVFTNEVNTAEDLLPDSESASGSPVTDNDEERIDSAIHGQIRSDDLSGWVEDQKKDQTIIDHMYKDQKATLDNGLTIIVDKDLGNKIYVPRERRKDLVMQVHRSMAHGMARRVRKVLTDKYIWPRMLSDLYKWLAECPECPLAKAKKNIEHNQYSPTEWRKPRNAYGVDFYGIRKSKQGNVGVLTVVDLFTRWVNFIPVKNEQAVTFAHVLMERVVFERGAFAVIVSDAAKAFIGKTASELAAMLQIQRIATFSYPPGNATTERNHMLLGQYLRMLPEDKRETWDEEIGAVAYASNMSINSSTGHSAFELECGFQPSMPGDLKFQDKLVTVQDSDLVGRTTEQQNQFVERVKSLHLVAAECDRAAKEVTRQKLNNPKGHMQIFNPGDKVMFYVTTAANQTDDQKKSDEKAWKQKHVIQWRRGTIVKKCLGHTSTYEVKSSDGVTYIRSVALIKPDHSIASVEEKYSTSSAEDSVDVKETELDIREGYFLACLDNTESKEFEVAKVLKCLENGEFLVHYYGTIYKKDPAKAVFKPAWQDKKGLLQLTFVKPNEAAPEKHTPYSGTLDRDLIAGVIHLNEDRTLKSESLEMLKSKHLTMKILNQKVVSKRSKKDKQIEIVSKNKVANNNNKKRKKGKPTKQLSNKTNVSEPKAKRQKRN